jgi:oligopeptide transport system substrate-binding protein
MALKQENRLQSAPAAGTQFLRFNVQKAPFSNLKFRQALNLACDTNAIVKEVMRGQELPATSLVPPEMGLKGSTPAYNPSKAAVLFEEALYELFITRNDLPTLTLSYIDAGRMKKIAEVLADGWKKNLNIEVKVEATPAASFYDKLFAQDYQLAAGSWFADYFDPMSFLSVFEHKDNGINCTGWSNPDYTRLLGQSNLEMDPAKRLQLLQQAEDILAADLPILPLFHFAFSYGKSDRLQMVKLSPLGMLDLEDAYFVDAAK